MFCIPRRVFGGAEGVGSRFHVLHSPARFRRCRRRRVPFSCFASPDSFSAVPRASGPVFMFYARGLIFSGTEGVGSCFPVLRSQSRFRRYRGRRVPFSYLTLLNSFSRVPRASGLIFMFCAPGLTFGGTVGVGSGFHVLRTRTRFRRYRRRRVPFSCFAAPGTFSAVRKASGPVFKFCAPGFVFDGFEGVGSRVLILRSRTRFWRYCGRRLQISCFGGHELIFGGTDGVGSRFHVLRSPAHFDGVEGVGSRFHVLRSGLTFGGTVGVGSGFHVLRA
jgi:hypothetical protein